MALVLTALWLNQSRLNDDVSMNKDEKGNDHGVDDPTLVEICIGLEINGYLPAEF